MAPKWRKMRSLRGDGLKFQGGGLVSRQPLGFETARETSEKSWEFPGIPNFSQATPIAKSNKQEFLGSCFSLPSLLCAI